MSLTRHQGRIAARWLKTLALGSRGSPVLEAAVAILVFGSIGTAILIGVSTVQNSGSRTENHSVAENLVRNQMEHIFSLPYQGPTSTYPSITGVPSGYSVTNEAQTFVAGDTNIAKIVVTVIWGSRDIIVLETLRSKE